MGIIVSPDELLLRPLQQVIYRENLRDLLAFYDSGNWDNLFPGLARMLDDDSLGVFNGTHRMLISSVVGKRMKFYVPQDNLDRLFSEHFPEDQERFVIQANQAICGGTFDEVPLYFAQALQRGISTVQQLKDFHGIRTLDDIRRIAKGEIRSRLIFPSVMDMGDGY